MTAGILTDFSTTDGSNTSFAGIDTAMNGMAPSDARKFTQALSGAVARYLADMGATATVSGTTTLTVTLAQAYTAYGSSAGQIIDGTLIALKLPNAATGATTLNINSIGAKAIRREGDSAIQANDWLAVATALFRYDASYNSSAGAWVLLNQNPATSTVFSDSSFRIQDNGDATKQLAFEVSGITTGNTRTATPPNSNFTMAALDVAAQVVTGGAWVTSNSLGTVSSGTTTLDPGTRPLWDYTNGGAHTLAPGTNTGSILLDITNNASAGAITVSGWTKVVGAFDTTSAHKFRCSATIGAAGSLLTIQAMQ